MKHISTILKFIIQNNTILYIFWILIIAILTLLPGSAMPDIKWDFISIDKTVHIFLFTILVFLGLLAINYGKLNFYGKWPIRMSMIAAIGYGYLLELVQSYIPQRSYDFADLAANCVGTIVGYGLFLGISKILPHNHTE